MDPKIKCLKCGSYIHDTDRCWNWQERRRCRTDEKYKESCDCDSCKSRVICKCCNNWSSYCGCVDERCPICNEHLQSASGMCWLNHTKPPCQFCKLPMYKSGNFCLNFHEANNNLCKECNMPERFSGNHKHDGSVCKNCGSLLTRGKCPYRCVNGGAFCIYCYWEGVVNNMCSTCKKDQTGQLTKAAIK